MFCCQRNEESILGYVFNENEIKTEDYYLHWHQLIQSYLINVDVSALINEIIFFAKGNKISLDKLEILFEKYTKKHEELIKIIASAFFAFPLTRCEQTEPKTHSNEEDNTSKSFNSLRSYLTYQKFNLKIIVLNYFIEEMDFNEKVPKIEESQDYNLTTLNITEVSIIHVIFFLIIYSLIPNESKTKIFFSLLDQECKKYLECDADLINILNCYIEICIFIPDIIGNYYLKTKTKLCKPFLNQIIQYKTSLLFLKNFKSIYEDFSMFIALNHIFYNPVTKQKIYHDELPFNKASRQKKNILFHILEKKSFNLFDPKEMLKSFSNFIGKKHEVFKIFTKTLNIYINKHNTMGYEQDFTDLSSKNAFKALKNENLLDEMKNVEKLIEDRDLYSPVKVKQRESSTLSILVNSTNNSPNSPIKKVIIEPQTNILSSLNNKNNQNTQNNQNIINSPKMVQVKFKKSHTILNRLNINNDEDNLKLFQKVKIKEDYNNEEEIVPKVELPVNNNKPIFRKMKTANLAEEVAKLKLGKHQVELNKKLMKKETLFNLAKKKSSVNISESNNLLNQLGKSANQSPEQALKSSLKVTPTQSPKSSLKRSQTHTPTESPNQTPNNSQKHFFPEQSPNQSPKKISKPSFKLSPEFSPQRPQERSPEQSPSKHSPKLCPQMSPKISSIFKRLDETRMDTFNLHNTNSKVLKTFKTQTKVIESSSNEKDKSKRNSTSSENTSSEMASKAHSDYKSPSGYISPSQANVMQDLKSPIQNKTSASLFKNKIEERKDG